MLMFLICQEKDEHNYGEQEAELCSKQTFETSKPFKEDVVFV